MPQKQKKMEQKKELGEVHKILRGEVFHVIAFLDWGLPSVFSDKNVTMTSQHAGHFIVRSVSKAHSRLNEKQDFVR